MVASMQCCVSMCGVVCSGNDEVHVSHSGSDDSLCGPVSHPCATLRYALSHHSNATGVSVNSSGGAYLAEASTHYLVIDHTVTLTGTGRQPAVIQCNDSQHSKLFHFSPAQSRRHITVIIQVRLSRSLCMSLGSIKYIYRIFTNPFHHRLYWYPHCLTSRTYSRLGFYCTLCFIVSYRKVTSLLYF